MIASFAAYAILLGLLIVSLAFLVERGVRLVGRPTRFIWAGAMVAMVVIPAVGTLFTSTATNTGQATLAISGKGQSGAAGSSSPSAAFDESAMSASPNRWATHWRAALDTIQRASRGADVVLIGLWALMSIGLLGVTLNAMSDVRRMRLGLESQTMLGTTVLVSEDIGPSAIGGNPAAIVVPRWVMALDDSLRSLVIRHEQEHLATRDPALLRWAMCLLVVMPWHPLLWLSWRRLRLAIEVDCDARVLRHETTPRQYGQLLLLMSHQRLTAPRGQHALISLAAPLSPRASQLKHRIDAMTTRPTKYKRATMVAIASGAFGASLLIAAVPAPARTLPPHRVSAASPSEAVTVSVTQVGIKNAELDSRGRLVGEVLIYSSGQAKVGIGSSEPQPLVDTIRLKALPAFSANVSNGDVHVELRGNGTIQLVGTATGGPASNMSASGNHLVLLQGGTGIGTIAGGERSRGQR